MSNTSSKSPSYVMLCTSTVRPRFHRSKIKRRYREISALAYALMCYQCNDNNKRPVMKYIWALEQYVQWDRDVCWNFNKDTILPFEGTRGASTPAAAHRKVDNEASYALSLFSKGTFQQSEGIYILAVNREKLRKHDTRFWTFLKRHILFHGLASKTVKLVAGQQFRSSTTVL